MKLNFLIYLPTFWTTASEILVASFLSSGIFANAMAMSSNSLVASANMLTKIYFPRLIIPASSVISGALDFGISLLILFGLALLVVAPPVVATREILGTGDPDSVSRAIYGMNPFPESIEIAGSAA